jgi:hypothetical protein
MRVIANRQLTGEYGTIAPNQEFECPNELAGQLRAKGMVRNAIPPRIEYETQVLRPQEAPEVSPRHPFRNRTLSDPKQENVATESDREFPAADIPSSGASDPRRRGGRSRPRS